VLLTIYHKRQGGALRFSPSCVRHMLGSSRYYILSGLMVLTFGQSDRIMIKLMMGDQPMGYYAAAMMCVGCTDFLFMAIIDSFRPVILDARLRSRREFEERMTGLYAIVCALSFGQSVLVTLLAKPMILILCGRAYLPAAHALRIVVWYTAFSYIGVARNIWMMAEGRQRLLLPVNLCGAVMNIALNLWLIPSMGIEGAAIATLLTQIFANVVMGFVVRPLRENNRLLLAAFSPAAVRGILRKL
jgi:O-antigen/teichoic acid export membrane protein